METIRLPDGPLFRGIAPAELASLLECLGARQGDYARGETVFSAGERLHAFGLVLEGSVQIEMEDFWGNRSILDQVGPGGLFGEAYACVPEEPLMVRVTAAAPCRLLLLDARRVLHPCRQACGHHQQLLLNLMGILARKNLHLSRRMLHTAPKTIRGRLTAYLSSQMLRQGTREVEIPFNRQQLAEYLGVDRSALSHEIGKMQKEGLLVARKSHFSVKSGAWITGEGEEPAETAKAKGKEETGRA